MYTVSVVPLLAYGAMTWYWFIVSYLFLSLASSLSSFSAIVDDSSTLLSSSVLD